MKVACIGSRPGSPDVQPILRFAAHSGAEDFQATLQTSLNSLVEKCARHGADIDSMVAAFIENVIETACDTDAIFSAAYLLLTREELFPALNNCSYDTRMFALTTLFDFSLQPPLPEFSPARRSTTGGLARELWEELLLERLCLAADGEIDGFAKELHLAVYLASYMEAKDSRSNEESPSASAPSDPAVLRLISGFELLCELSQQKVDWNDRRGKLRIEHVLERLLGELSQKIDEYQLSSMAVRLLPIFERNGWTRAVINFFDVSGVELLPPEYLEFLLDKALVECGSDSDSLTFCDWTLAATALMARLPAFDIAAFCSKRSADLLRIIAKRPRETDQPGVSEDDIALDEWFGIPDWNEENEKFFDVSAPLLNAIKPIWEDRQADFSDLAFLCLFTCKLLAHLSEKATTESNRRAYGSLFEIFEESQLTIRANILPIDPSHMEELVQRSVRWKSDLPNPYELQVRWLCANEANRSLAERLVLEAIPKTETLGQFANLLSLTCSAGDEFSLNDADDEVFKQIQCLLGDVSKGFYMRARFFELAACKSFSEAKTAEEWVYDVIKRIDLTDVPTNKHRVLFESLFTVDELAQLEELLKS